MYKMMRIALAIVLVLCSVFTIAANSEAEDTAEEGMKTYVIQQTGFGEPHYPNAPHREEVLAAINEKLAVDLGFQIDVERFLYTNDAFEEKFILDVSTGVEYDIARQNGGRAKIVTVAEKDLALPLDDLLAEYGQDLLAMYSDNVWDEVRYDGKIYGIPNPLFRTVTGTWYRNDWFEALGLDIPTTLDEFEAVLKALKENDPDGNGVDDTIPMAGPLNMLEMLLIGLFTDTPGDYVDADGNVMPMVFNPGYRDYLETVSDWYAKGYINDLIFENNFNASNEVFAKSKLGIVNTNQWDLEWGPLKPTNVANPEWDIRYLRQLDDDVKAYMSAGLVNDFQIIPVTSEDPEVTMQYMNWVLTNEENHMLANAGIEGLTYVFEDGEMKIPAKYREEYAGGNELMDQFFTGNNAAFAIKNLPAVTPAETKVAYAYTTSEVPLEKVYITVTAALSVSIPDGVQLQSEDAGVIVNQYVQEIIQGKRPVSEWEEMLEKYEEVGGLEKYKLYTEAYNAK